MKTILIVDDEKNIRKLYERELHRDGYKVVVASSGEEALAIVNASPPDLIVLDIRMPQMNGIETLNRLMVKHRHIPVILNSAYSSYKDDYLTWAADAYVIKSADMDELKSRIKEILDKQPSA